MVLRLFQKRKIKPPMLRNGNLCLRKYSHLPRAFCRTSSTPRNRICLSLLMEETRSTLRGVFALVAVAPYGVADTGADELYEVLRPILSRVLPSPTLIIFSLLTQHTLKLIDGHDVPGAVRNSRKMLTATGTARSCQWLSWVRFHAFCVSV